MPQAYPSHGIATRSPSATSVTSGPSSTTIPTPSCPGTNGGLGLTGQSPCAAWMSVWHRPEASTLTRIWPWPSCGPCDLIDRQRRGEVVDDGGAVGGCLRRFRGRCLFENRCHVKFLSDRYPQCFCGLPRRASARARDRDAGNYRSSTQTASERTQTAFRGATDAAVRLGLDYSGSSRPCARAWRTRSARVLRRSFCMMWARWLSAVRTEMKSFAEISWFV